MGVDSDGAATTFQDLKVWRKAHRLVLDIYRETRMLPKTEQFGVTAQIRRSAVSVPVNIAEGFNKRGQADKARFLNIAQGSLGETGYYLILIHDLGYFDTRELQDKAEEVSRMLNAFYRSIMKSIGVEK